MIPKTPVLKIDPARKLYFDIESKATRYGKLQEPFLIAVWGRHMGRERPELATLYGSPKWMVTPLRAYETRQPDGIFTTLTDESEPRYPYVSAVAFFRSSSTGGAVDDSLVVYHNPYARFPLTSTALSDFPQYRDMESI